MSKKSEDVIAEIFERIKDDEDGCALQAPLLELWKADRWTAEEITRATEETYKPK